MCVCVSVICRPEACLCLRQSRRARWRRHNSCRILVAFPWGGSRHHLVRTHLTIKLTRACLRQTSRHPPPPESALSADLPSPLRRADVSGRRGRNPDARRSRSRATSACPAPDAAEQRCPGRKTRRPWPFSIPRIQGFRALCRTADPARRSPANLPRLIPGNSWCGNQARRHDEPGQNGPGPRPDSLPSTRPMHSTSGLAGPRMTRRVTAISLSTKMFLVLAKRFKIQGMMMMMININVCKLRCQACGNSSWTNTLVE